MAIVGEAQGVYIIIQKTHFIADHRGSKAFVKAIDTADPERRELSRRQIEREKRCLGVLEGLAVPAPLALSPSEARRLVSRKGVFYAAQRYVPGRPLHRAGLPPDRLIGAWLFVAEQLAAFRRRGILYTDIKPENVLASRSPFRVTILDFDQAADASPGRVYPRSSIGYSQLYAAPEHHRRGTLTEQTAVYQLAMTWVRSFSGLTNAALGHPTRGLEASLRRLRGLGAPGLAEVVRACLAPDFRARPRDYDAVWERLRALPEGGLPREAKEHLRRLRTPYAERLAALGL